MTRRDFLIRAGASALALACPPGLAASPPALAGRRVVRFAHLTDLHFTSRIQARYPTSHRHIRHAVADLNRAGLDFVLITGDMLHFAADVGVEVEALRDALAGLAPPCYAAFGNHDAEGAALRARKRFMMRHLGDRGLAAGEAWYDFSPVPGIRVVVLDTTDVGADRYEGWAGTLGERQRRWLTEVLGRHRDETLIVAMHHPPVTPYPVLERMRLGAGDAHWLRGTLDAHPGAPLVLAGHYHFGGQEAFGQSRVLLGPSLVEHPHPYRIIEVWQAPAGPPVVGFTWHSLDLHGDEEAPCATGPAGWRAYGLMRLSYGRAGALALGPPG